MTAVVNGHRPALAILNRMASILDQITKLSYNLSGLALASMLVLVLNEVVMRYFFNAPTTWSSDVNQWLLAISVMFALPEVTRVNGNVAITIILERLPEKRKILLARVLALASFVACMVAFYIAGMECIRQFNTGIVTMWVNPIPKWWISSVLPFGFLLSAVQFLRLGVMPAPRIEE